MVGALSGLGLGVIGAVPVLALGVDPTAIGGQSTLILLGLAAQFVAGLVAARVAGRDHEIHGGLGAIVLFGVVGAISLATAAPGVAALATGAVIALGLGTLGGFLTRARSD